MRKLILIFPLLLSGCLYVKQDIGLTTYQYDSCKEYYDENGTYHKECHDGNVEVLLNSVIDETKKYVEKYKSKIFPSKSSSSVSRVKKDALLQHKEADSKEIVYKKKKCVCSKRCIKSCKVKDIYCLKKCCHEKK